MNIFHLVGFLKPWFLTNITSPGPGAKKTQGFARCLANKVEITSPFQVPSPFFATQTYLFSLSLTNVLLPPTCCDLPTTISLFRHLPATTSTYHYLPLPTCNYLPHPPTTLPANFFHSLPATTCQSLPATALPATTCRYLPLPATICYYLTTSYYV